jgi:tRNA (adenine57-N1/adenine58-N1)-methyltransferase
MYSLAHLPAASSADARSAAPGDCCRAGETVIIHCSGELSAAVLSASGAFETRFGRFAHADIVGAPYGSRVYARAAGARGGKGFVEVLRWSPELWTRALAHRTQILYFFDCAAVVAQLGLRPGSVVVESGTGSGSLTHALARAVAPSGVVHSFEFNAARVSGGALIPGNAQSVDRYCPQ